MAENETLSAQNRGDLTGLLLIGGQSTRMGIDKSTLTINGLNLYDHSFNMLSAVVGQVFVSCRENQKQVIESGFRINDRYKMIGPIGGLLTAMERYPDKNWLVLAVDMLHMDQQTLQALIDLRVSSAKATIYTSEGRFEPLCAIYESSIYPELKAAVAVQKYGLQAILRHLPVQHVKVTEQSKFFNLNDRAQLEQVSKDSNPTKRST